MRRPVLLAAALTVAVGAWLVSGHLADRLPGAVPPAPAVVGPAPTPSPQPFRVVVRPSVAEPVQREIVANGRTEAARKVVLKAEVKGRVVAVPVARGATVASGEVLVRLDERDRIQRVRMAEAMVAQRRIENEAAQRLRAKGFSAETEAAGKAAALEEALAVLEETRINLDRLKVIAPFAGVLDRRPVEIGDYVEEGHEIATVIELDPLLVVAHLNETDVARVRPGLAAAARTAAGDRLEGRIRYLASEADAGTRTFRVELEAVNPGARIGSGISAELRIPLEPVAAHRVPSSLLVLDDRGALGVQAVDEADTVRFLPATIVRAASDQVWLGGLPEQVRVVAVGQAFVREGEKVTPVPAPVAAAAAGPGSVP
jgi:multidrug efflux system membrane fusion protein